MSIRIPENWIAEHDQDEIMRFYPMERNAGTLRLSVLIAQSEGNKTVDLPTSNLKEQSEKHSKQIERLDKRGYLLCFTYDVAEGQDMLLQTVWMLEVSHGKNVIMPLFTYSRSAQERSYKKHQQRIQMLDREIRRLSIYGER